MIKDKFKKILENKQLKSFLDFQKNTTSTIAELKKKDFSFNQYKINSLLYILIIFLIFSSFGSDDTKGKVLQKSHVIKCKNTTGQMAGTKTEYIMDKNNMTVKINFNFSDKALEEFKKAGMSQTEKKTTKTWNIQSWNPSNIHVVIVSGNLMTWDGIGWVQPAIQEITGLEGYEHDKCKVK